MATFEDYTDHKAWWFVTYLRLAEAICTYPSLSAKNSGLFKVFEMEDEKLERLERRLYGITDDQTKKGMEVL